MSDDLRAHLSPNLAELTDANAHLPQVVSVRWWGAYLAFGAAWLLFPVVGPGPWIIPVAIGFSIAFFFAWPMFVADQVRRSVTKNGSPTVSYVINAERVVVADGHQRVEQQWDRLKSFAETDLLWMLEFRENPPIIVYKRAFDSEEREALSEHPGRLSQRRHRSWSQVVVIVALSLVVLIPLLWVFLLSR